MKMAKTLITALFAVGMLVGFSGMASAAAISCGGCHGDTTKTPAYESHGLPTNADNCAGDARGLHGVHNNYSSASYGMDPYGARGSCGYCHTSSGGGHPTATHDNGYINVTSTTAAPGLSYDQPSSTCTNACHKNGGATAQWGNYTSVATIKLTCSSCHSDASDNGASLSAGAGKTNKGHIVHLTGSWLTGGVKIVLGSYSGYMYKGAADGNTNAVCQMCHPDNTGDFWKDGVADDGTKKAYPHASDGTNVVSVNATVGGLASVAFTNASGINGTTTLSCTSACHLNQSSYQQTDPQWDDVWEQGGSHCEMCHNHQPSAGINNSATVPLTFAHSLHFQNISTMLLRKAACNDCHKVASLHMNYKGVINLVRLPVQPGTAGLGSASGWSNISTLTVHGTCTNSCHITASPDWTTIATGSVTPIQGCASCHNYPDGNNWAADTGHAVQYDTSVNPRTHLPLATSFNKATDDYATVMSDTTKCGKCHTGATHMNGTRDVSSTGIGYNNCGTGDFTINVNTSGSDVTCSNVSCHSGKTTPNWY